MGASGLDGLINGLKDAVKEAKDSVGPALPFWARYVTINSTSSIIGVVTNGFKMHAAVTGNTLYSHKLSFEEIAAEIYDDLKSKLKEFYIGYSKDAINSGDDYNYLISSDSFAYVSFNRNNISIYLYTFDESLKDFIIKNASIHTDNFIKKGGVFANKTGKR